MYPPEQAQEEISEIASIVLPVFFNRMSTEVGRVEELVRDCPLPVTELRRRMQLMGDRVVSRYEYW